jgi:ubiquitin-like protein 4
MRSGETVTLTDITLDTSIHDVKTQYAQKSGQPLDKVKLLLNRKPAADLKTLKELGVNEDVELTVMVMGGASSTPAASSPATEKTEPPLPIAIPASDKMDIDSPAPQSEKAQAEVEGTKKKWMTTDSILQTEEFWTDLRGFLTQRLRDQSEAERLAGVFRQAWTKR